MKKIKCLRVYHNDQRAPSEWTEAEAKEWLEYNKSHRWGCALFVDGKCEHFGYLGEKRCRTIEEELKQEQSNQSL